MDEKQRIALPKRVREMLESASPASLFLTPETDGSLGLYTEGSLQELAARLATVSPTRQDVRAFNRLFYAEAERLELDDQGRFRVPANLVRHAALGKEVVLVGVRDHLEIWDKSRWEAYLAAQAGNYDRLAEQAFGERPR